MWGCLQSVLGGFRAGEGWPVCEGGGSTPRLGVCGWRAPSPLRISPRRGVSPCQSGPLRCQTSGLSGVWPRSSAQEGGPASGGTPRADSTSAAAGPSCKTVCLSGGKVSDLFLNRGCRFYSEFCADGCPASLLLPDFLTQRGRAGTWARGRWAESSASFWTARMTA